MDYTIEVEKKSDIDKKSSKKSIEESAEDPKLKEKDVNIQNTKNLEPSILS